MVIAARAIASLASTWVGRYGSGAGVVGTRAGVAGYTASTAAFMAYGAARGAANSGADSARVGRSGSSGRSMIGEFASTLAKSRPSLMRLPKSTCVAARLVPRLILLDNAADRRGKTVGQ